MTIEQLLDYHITQARKAYSRSIDARASRHTMAHWVKEKDFHSAAARAIQGVINKPTGDQPCL